ncbi:unnamed protein product [Rhizophagus irregularis]|nr:unnamed protein product [Rhizophagus irregularis]
MSESSESNGTVLVYIFEPQCNSWSGINVVNNDIYKKYKFSMLKYNIIVNDFFYLDVFVASNNQRLLYQDFNTIPRNSDVASAKGYVNNTLSYVAEDAESLQSTLPFVPTISRQSRIFFFDMVDDSIRWSVPMTELMSSGRPIVYEINYGSWGLDDDIKWCTLPYVYLLPATSIPSHIEAYEISYGFWGLDDDIKWWSAPLTAELIDFGLPFSKYNMYLL